MVNDYISRSEFGRTMQERYCFNCERKGNNHIFGVACKACRVLDMLDEVEQFQSADVRQVVRGKWIVDSIASNIFSCSVCGQDAPVEPTGGTEYKSNFCPNCGADMRKVAESEQVKECEK